MLPRLSAFAVVIALAASVAVSAQGKIKQYGRAIVEYRGDDVLALAAYEYAQRNHAGPWLLIEFAVQAKNRIVVHRDQLTLLGPREEKYPIATQQAFLADQKIITGLLQNAAVWRKSFEPYFTSRPTFNTIQFVNQPGKIVHESVVTHMDEVATGDLFFKSPAGKWEEGDYRLVLNHPKAKAELPIKLQ
jgi:hypothetical protein